VKVSRMYKFWRWILLCCLGDNCLLFSFL